MKWTVITWFIGISLLLVAALMTVSGIIALCIPGDESWAPLLFSATITGSAGVFPLIFVRKGQHRLSFREGNCIVVLAWILACIFGMIPFLLYGGEFTPVNALFESISGFTTTGASILNDIEALPKGLLFWRISTAWVGGIGIVTLFSMLTGRADKSTLSKAEISSIARESFAGGRSVSFANRMLITYLALTVVSWNASVAFFDNPAAEFVMTLTMLAAGIHFGILFLAILRGKPEYFWKSETIKVFLALVGLAIVVVTADLLINGHYPSFGSALRDASFQVASISTTTGFGCDHIQFVKTCKQFLHFVACTTGSISDILNCLCRICL